MTAHVFNSKLSQKMRQDLCRALRRWISAEGLNQREAARILRVHPPQISYIARGHIRGFSMDRLMEYCARAHIRVDLLIFPALPISHAKRHRR